ncbi:MAG: T9SS type A sorting domain-containing protein [Candidatus Eisenbacteria bacterium]|nr:T9SS type A sorting domain-containing protein [Candidatus Latescibacterota bacterium]MBD3302177.1 T9SS type A sorting domain-containing protein [Candidatus Eisenbacteria bacterium]
MSTRYGALLALLGGLLCGAFNAGASVEPTGDIVKVNDDQSGHHRFTATTSNGTNQVLWVWEGEGPGDDAGIFGKLTSDWIEFRINDRTENVQGRPSAAWNQAGDRFVVAWQDDRSGILARWFDLYGNPLSDDLLVDGVDGSEVLSRPIVRCGDEGTFVVAWHQSDGGEDTIWIQMFASDGEPLTDRVRATTTVRPKQTMTMNRNIDGTTVIVWTEQELNGSWRLHGTTLARDLAIVEQDFSGIGLGGNQAQPDIAFMDADAILLVWYQGAGWAQILQLDGDPVGDPFRVSSEASTGQSPSVGRAESGHYVVAWKNDDGIGVRCLDEDGVPFGVDALVEPPMPIYQIDLTFSHSDIFVIAWSGDSDGPALSDVFTQQWGPSASDVTDGDPARRTALWSRPRPSVFAHRTIIEYELSEPVAVSLDVYDAQGRRVRTLVDRAHRSAGIQQSSWDGRLADGSPAPNGTYFYRIDAGNRFTSGRVQRLR